jgi:PAS domain S-box-containing protein
MELKRILEQYDEKIQDDWFHALTTNDPDSNYYQISAREIRPLMKDAARGFYDVLVLDQWDKLDAFITRIAHMRFAQGFKVSEVQKTFELYRQILIPLIIEHVSTRDLCKEMLRLQECMVFAITRFSEFFQNIHDDFIKSHAESLEREVVRRTKELAESEQKYKTLVEDIHDGYFVLIDGKIAFANHAFARMHGYVQNNILKTDFLNHVAPESYEVVNSAYRASLDGKKAPNRIEYLRLYKDGRRLFTEVIAKRSTFENQIATIGICRDIGERIALSKKIHETKKLKALAKQAGSLAHEIRNPMSAVKMNLQMFEQSEQDPVKLHLIETSLDEITRIEQSLVEMMNLSIPFRLEKKYVSVRQLLENAMDVMGQRIRNNNLAVSVRLSRQLDMLKIDPHRIELAVLNLLFNAIEAQPDSGKIYLSSRRLNHNNRTMLEIIVGDNGPGIPKEILPHLFDPMFTQKRKGSGIGLNNVKRIVEAHGGEVKVTPRKPLGTNFSIRLPLE